MIKVTFEYATVDEAIVALAKLVGVPQSKAPLTASTGGSNATGGAASQPSTRRGRSDKGQARGSYKNPPTVAAAPVVPEPVVSPTTGAVAIPEPAAPAQAPVASTVANPPLESGSGAAAHTVKDLLEAIGKVFNTKGLPVALQVLSRFGANTYRDIKPEQYAEFIKHAVFVSEGGAV